MEREKRKELIGVVIATKWTRPGLWPSKAEGSPALQEALESTRKVCTHRHNITAWRQGEVGRDQAFVRRAVEVSGVDEGPRRG